MKSGCKYMGHLINQGVWWCNLQEDKISTHLDCDCENCPDYEEQGFAVADSETSVKWEKVSEI